MLESMKLNTSCLILPFWVNIINEKGAVKPFATAELNSLVSKEYFFRISQFKISLKQVKTSMSRSTPVKIIEMGQNK